MTAPHKRNPGLPVKREPKVGEYHEIMDPFLREWLAKKKVPA
jgi:hypothetical protein